MRALNASFANTGYLGIPLVTVAYGERAALPAALATVATNIVSFALAIVCLELFVNPRARRRAARAYRRRAMSPLIWPIALAILIVAIGVKVPLPVERFATLLAARRRAVRAFRHRPVRLAALDPRRRGGELAEHASSSSRFIRS